MVIETKYDLEEYVWVRHNGYVLKEVIRAFYISVFENKPRLIYYLEGYSLPFIESELFPTKEELLKSL